MRPSRFLVCTLKSVASVAIASSLLLVCAVAQNPVPQIVGPVHPDAVAPGGGDFTLSVYGANFVSGAVVNWNYQPRATAYISGHELQAQILSTDIAKNAAGYITVTNPAPGGGSSSASWAQVEVHEPVTTIGMAPPVFEFFGALGFAQADFTHSASLDLVGEYDGLALERGFGNGTFGVPLLVNPAWVIETPFVYGDFNNDGNLDVVLDVGRQSSLDVTSMRTVLGNGGGGFQLGPELNELHGLGTPVVGDFNRDGNLDLITSGNENNLVLLGNGDGSFSLFATYPYWRLATELHAADVNNDGILDLILVGPSFDGEAITIWEQIGNGDGTFQPPKELLQLTQTNVCGFIYDSTLQFSDFNNDGNIDLIFCNGKGFGVMLGNGDGTFRTPRYTVIQPGNTAGFSFTVGDMNSDGNADVIVAEYAGQSTMAVYLGKGDGTFQRPQNVDEPGVGLTGNVVGDYNQDGLPDAIFLSDGGMNVVLQQ